MKENQHRFQFVRSLGKGVLGEVHEVIDESNGQSVVLKVFIRCRPKSPEQFRMDFQSIARLDHDHLVKMFHLIDPASDTNVILEEKFGVPGLAFTQELVDGTDLLTFLRRPATPEEDRQLSDQRGSRTIDIVPDSSDLDPSSAELIMQTSEVDEDPGLDVASSIVAELAKPIEAPPLDVVLLRLQEILPQIISALEYLHRFHRVHGNLRPTNILITNDGVVKLTDYSIVADLAYFRPNEEEISLLQAPENLQYLAPEITNEATVASDRYALGCVLFEAIAGESPFEALEFDMQGEGRSRLRPPPLADHVPECPQSWGDLVDGLLRDDPTERPTLLEVLDQSRRHVAQTVVVPTRRIEPVKGFEGRKEILRGLIHEARRATDDTRLQLSILRGVTGVGKTTLTQQLGHFLSRRGWLVLSAQCFHREVQPHQSWVPIAEQLAEVIDNLPLSHAEQITTARSRATRLLSALGGLDSTAEMTRLDAVSSLHEVIAYVSSQRPVLIILDDIENASWDSETLLVDLLSDVRQLRGLCVATWTEDSPRAKSPRLFEDLDRTLIDYRSFEIGPLDRNEAPELAAITPETIAVPEGIYPLLTKWWNAYPALVEAGTKNASELPVHEWFVDAAEKIFDDLKPAEQTVLSFIALSSGFVPREFLYAAVQNLDSKFREDQIVSATDALLATGFIGEGSDDGLYLSHDTIRVAVDRAIDDATSTGIYNKLAAQWKSTDDAIAFEYFHRAGHITTAVAAAQKQAEDAAASFAVHRSAKIWNWLEENKDRLPGGSKVDPLPKLANVEYAAAEFKKAAELFELWAERDQDDEERSAEVRLREGECRLRALDFPGAQNALAAALKTVGGHYRARGVNVAGAIERGLAAWALLSSPPLDPLPSDRLKTVQRAYQAAVSWDRYISGQHGPDAVAQLIRVAQKRRGATSWGIAKLESARRLSRENPSPSDERIDDLLEEALRALEKSEEDGLQRAAFLFNEVCRMEYGETDALTIDALFDSLSANATFAELRLSLDLAQTALRYGCIERASRFALEVIRSNRRDALLSAKAYGVLADAALLNGDVEGASLFIAGSGMTIDFDRPTPFGAEWLRRRSRWSIATGEPEVGVAQCLLFAESNDFQKITGPAKTLVWLTLSQCLNAQLIRQKRIQSPRASDTVAQITRCFKKLDGAENTSQPMLSAEISRAQALFWIEKGKRKKAEKALVRAIDVLSDKPILIEMNKCLEAFAIIRSEFNSADAAGMFEQSSLLNKELDLERPLTLEGWPLRNELASYDD